MYHRVSSPLKGNALEHNVTVSLSQRTTITAVFVQPYPFQQPSTSSDKGARKSECFHITIDAHNSSVEHKLNI